MIAELRRRRHMRAAYLSCYAHDAMPENHAQLPWVGDEKALLEADRSLEGKIQPVLLKPLVVLH